MALDGVELRVVDPGGAVRVLLAKGVQGIDDPDEFVQRHRQVVRDPHQVRAQVARERRTVGREAVMTVAFIAAAIAFKVTDDERYAIAGLGVVAVAYLLERVTRGRATA